MYSRQYARLEAGYVFDDGRGGIDLEKIEQRAGRSWWQQAHLWIQGRPRFPGDTVTFLTWLLGEPEPETEFGAFWALYDLADSIEREARKREPKMPPLLPVDMVLRIMLQEMGRDARRALPLKQLHLYQQSNGIETLSIH